MGIPCLWCGLSPCRFHIERPVPNITNGSAVAYGACRALDYLTEQELCKSNQMGPELFPLVEPWVYGSSRIQVGASPIESGRIGFWLDIFEDIQKAQIDFFSLGGSDHE